MTYERVVELLSFFSSARILVVGDYYLDEVIMGVLSGVSLEAPVPIFEWRERRHNPGAAGNLARNAAAMGASVCAIGVVGDDSNGKALLEALLGAGVDISGMMPDASRPTNTYGKLKASVPSGPPQEILRMDTPPPTPLSRAMEEQIAAFIEERASQATAIIVGDQAGAVASELVRRTIVECARKHGLLTVADSRGQAADFAGFDVLTPNAYEACRAVGLAHVDDGSIQEAGGRLLRVAQRVAITRSEKGIMCFEQDGRVSHVPAATSARHVVDTTGAGDTLTAALALGLAAGGTFEEAALLGNAAAGIAVRQAGAAAVTRAELEAAFTEEKPAKLRTIEELEALAPRLQAEGKRVVWTNGCFDILHAGHVLYLQGAASEGDVLVVGMNSDASVRAIKGPSRPVMPEHERAMVLSALACVDYVVLFSEPTTVMALQRLKPDVYAKGGDYTIDTINQEERRLIEGYGGRIALLPGVEGQSTTNLIERMRS